MSFALPAEGAGSFDQQALEAFVAIGASGAPAVLETTEAVVLARRVSADLTVADHISPHAMATEAGRRIALEIPRLVHTRLGADVIRFPSVAEYLVHFIEQLLAGRPVDVWYFRPLRTFMCAGMAETIANLARAEPEAWPRVWRLLEKRGLLAQLRKRVGAGFRELRSLGIGVRPHDLTDSHTTAETLAGHAAPPQGTTDRGSDVPLEPALDDVIGDAAVPVRDSVDTGHDVDERLSTVLDPAAGAGSESATQEHGPSAEPARPAAPRDTRMFPPHAASPSGRKKSGAASTTPNTGRNERRTEPLVDHTIPANASGTRDEPNLAGEKAVTSGSWIPATIAPGGSPGEMDLAAREDIGSADAGLEASDTVSNPNDETHRPTTDVSSGHRSDGRRDPASTSEPVSAGTADDAVPRRAMVHDPTALPAPVLGADEGWPLFLSAWAVVEAAVGGKNVPRSRPRKGATGAKRRKAKKRPRRTRDDPPATAYKRFLATRPSAPATWADSMTLGRYVADIAAWVLQDAVPRGVTLDVARAERVLASHGWFDVRPMRELLCDAARNQPSRQAAATRHNARGKTGDRMSPSPVATPFEEPLDSNGGAGMNRTRALRILAAVRSRFPLPAEAGAMPGVAYDATRSHAVSETEAERWFVEDVVAALVGSVVAPTATQVSVELEKLRAIVLDGSKTDSGKSPSTIAPASLVTLSYAAESLTDEERRELAARLAAGVALCGERELETEAVGLFLLVRPLMDLQFHGLASKCEINRSELAGVLRSFARLAGGVDTHDPAVDLFAFGPPEQGSDTPALWGGGDPPRGDKLCDLAIEVWDHAAGLGLNIPAVPDTEPSGMSVERLCEMILPVICGQFARWLRGFQTSSTDFVLRSFVRRQGGIAVPYKESVLVRWPASAYDVVLEMAGYLDDVDAVPWWSGRGIRWQR